MLLMITIKLHCKNKSPVAYQSSGNLQQRENLYFLSAIISQVFCTKAKKRMETSGHRTYI